jgi:hypothetical protein
MAAVDTTDYLALNQRLWGKQVAKHAAQIAKPRFEAALAAAADAAAMALPPVIAELCDHVDTLFNPRYVYHGEILLTHMDLSMFNGRLMLSDDLRQDGVSIYYDRETGGALLDYMPLTHCHGMGVSHGMYALPAGATMRDLIRTFCGADCEIGFTSVWKSRGIPAQRTEFLGFPMSALGDKESRHEIDIHVTKTTPLRPTTGQIVGGVVVN